MVSLCRCHPSPLTVVCGCRHMTPLQDTKNYGHIKHARRQHPPRHKNMIKYKHGGIRDSRHAVACCRPFATNRHTAAQEFPAEPLGRTSTQHQAPLPPAAPSGAWAEHCTAPHALACAHKLHGSSIPGGHQKVSAAPVCAAPQHQNAAGRPTQVPRPPRTRPQAADKTPTLRPHMHQRADAATYLLTVAAGALQLARRQAQPPLRPARAGAPAWPPWGSSTHALPG